MPLVADIPGSIERGLQFRQAEQLRPIQQQTAQLGLEQKQQDLQLGGIGGLQAQENLTRDQDANAFVLNVRSAMELDLVPNEQKAEFLINKIQNADPNRDMTQSKKALELVQSNRFQELDQGTKQLLSVAERSGIIKAPAGTATKPTASQQDFETFKKLNAKARSTGDPIDIQLAKQFGVQSGFDRLSPQELADIDVKKESKKTLGRQAAAASKEAFDSLKNVRRTIANMDDAIKALDNDAQTGPIISKLPSFRQASIELDNIKGRMGLDVISSVSFGALSESELKFALDTALPTDLEPKALREWLVEKKRVQGLLANELRKAASFLGTPGNTIADYIAQQENESQEKKADFAAQSDDELLSF